MTDEVEKPVKKSVKKPTKKVSASKKATGKKPETSQKGQGFMDKLKTQAQAGLEKGKSLFGKAKTKIEEETAKMKKDGSPVKRIRSKVSKGKSTDVTDTKGEPTKKKATARRSDSKKPAVKKTTTSTTTGKRPTRAGQKKARPAPEGDIQQQ